VTEEEEWGVAWWETENVIRLAESLGDKHKVMPCGYVGCRTCCDELLKYEEAIIKKVGKKEKLFTRKREVIETILLDSAPKCSTHGLPKNKVIFYRMKMEEVVP